MKMVTTNTSKKTVQILQQASVVTVKLKPPNTTNKNKYSHLPTSPFQINKKTKLNNNKKNKMIKTLNLKKNINSNNLPHLPIHHHYHHINN
jgi:hypothetical protein